MRAKNLKARLLSILMIISPVQSFHLFFQCPLFFLPLLLASQISSTTDLLRGGEFGTPGSHLAIPFTAEVTDSLISVLRSALAQDTPKITEPALACLHKLVAYAYLQGETRPSGRLDDTTSLVTSVVGMTVKAGASTTASVQLSVVKTLLTLATAEHFMCHGDTLMQAVRTVFNIAVGGAAEDIKSTAKSALLQMLNTIVKRVSQQIMVSSVVYFV